jgi:uncharacterized membrane protein
MSLLQDVSRSARQGVAATQRFVSVDALRGLIMVIMALDHVRDFVHVGAMTFSPEDLSRTTPVLFLTRWVTHICAPTFMLLAGVGAGLRLQRDGSKASLSRFLFTRGLWLIVIELTVMRLAMNFSASFAYPVILLVLWALGLSMILLAALIYLPIRWLVVLSVAAIVLHNAFDGMQQGMVAPQAVRQQSVVLTALAEILHRPGVFIAGGVPFFVAYPIVPWFAVMALGFCFAGVLSDPARRQRVLIVSGLSLIAGFVVLRAINIYGDPSPWSVQSSGVMTVLSFLRTTKYPPSLQFLLMTLGPALLLLAYFDRRQLSPQHPLVLIGRVPFFYYVGHFWLAHVVVAAMLFVEYGSTAWRFVFNPLPSMGGPRALFPSDVGYPLWAAYLVWIGILLAMYPACRWFALLKSRHRDWWWLSYL